MSGKYKYAVTHLYLLQHEMPSDCKGIEESRNMEKSGLVIGGTSYNATYVVTEVSLHSM